MSTEILNVVCRERECCGMPDARIHTHICARHTFVHGMGETSKRSAGKACKDTLTTHARTNARTHARARRQTQHTRTHAQTHTQAYTHTHTTLSHTHDAHTRTSHTASNRRLNGFFRRYWPFRRRGDWRGRGARGRRRTGVHGSAYVAVPDTPDASKCVVTVSNAGLFCPAC
jgi:hypothetical protein